MNTSSKKYPIEKNRYNQSTGRLLEHRISQIFRKLGYQTWISPGQSNGIDLKVFNDDGFVLVAEIINWSKYTEMAEKRRRDIMAISQNTTARES